MASYDDAIRIPPKPEGMGWSEHVYRVISAQPIEIDFMGERVKSALRFSQDDFDDLIRSMEPYMVPVEGEVPATLTTSSPLQRRHRDGRVSAMQRKQCDGPTPWMGVGHQR